MSEVGGNNALSGEWSSVPLGELAEFVTSGSRNWSKYYADEGALFVRTQDIKHNHLSETGIPRVKLPEKAEGKRTRIHKGDLLITITGYIGRVAAIDKEVEEAYVSQSVALVRLRNPEYAKFIQYQLLARRAGATQLEAMAYGLGRPVLNLDNIRNARIKVAPLDQQKRIVAEIEKQFSRLDEAVANLKRVKANLKRYKAAVLKAAVEGRLVETEAELARREGRSYETGDQLLQRILETRRSQWQGKGKYKEPAAPDTTNLPELPEGWVWVTLPQLGELARGKSKHRPRDDAKLYGGPYPFIQTGDVRRSEGNIAEHTQTYSEFGLAQSRLWPAGTLCITIAANIAETGILNFASCFPDSVVGFIASSDHVTTRYVELFIRTAKERLERFAPATAQKNINLEVLEAVAVALPPIVEQHRIVAEVDRRLSLLRKTEAQVNANLQRAESLRQAILQKNFVRRA